MVRSFSLSLAAVDILFEHCGLGRAPFPFEVPHLGETHDARRQIRDAVFRDLEGRGLVRGGRLDADVEAAVTTFARGGVAITAAAMLEGEARLFARSAAEGQAAVLVKQEGNLLVFEQIRPEALVPAIVDLLPATRPAPGQSVTVAKPERQPEPRGRAGEDSYDPFAGTSAPRGRSNPQLRAVERMFEKPKVRLGQFTAFARGTEGKQRHLEPVAWFDTEDGRVFCTSRAADDGQKWLTYAPADNARIIQHLMAQVRTTLGG
ncbi:ESX secretion-associated protein EspG [Saccharomonospora saliphila]|uniref:ESX secretion-associated protein EspG n=1 Tax=Saccharomonospora saliphila TaxID=369829 RepID=UPI00038165F9|nr:ESX secretion-associated protein EspG [Saccharomonospora saliphila]